MIIIINSANWMKLTISHLSRNLADREIGMYQGECPIANKHLMTVIYLNLIFLAYKVEQKVPKAAIFMAGRQGDA